MAGDLDRVKWGLAQFVRAVFSRIDYLALYPAKVIAQRGDGSLDVVPDDGRFAGLSGVPVRYGIPGVTATVAPGARVLIGFAGGDPSRPIAEFWESATLISLSFAGGVQPIARVGDAAGPFAIASGSPIVKA